MLSRIACGFRLALTNVNISVYLSLARGASASDVAVMRFYIPAIEICPPSDAGNPGMGMGSGSGNAGSGSGMGSSSHPTGKVVDNISYLLSKNVDIRGLTVTMSRKAAYIKPSDGINSSSTNTSSSSEDRESNVKSVGTIYVQSNTKKSTHRAITPSDLCYTTQSPLTDVLLNPVHLILSAVVSAVPNTATSRNQGSSSSAVSKSKHKLDLGVELSNVEFSPTFEQLYLLSEAISSIKLEQIRCRLRFFRPRGMSVRGHARKWWKYAYEAVREIISERRR